MGKIIIRIKFGIAVSFSLSLQDCKYILRWVEAILSDADDISSRWGLLNCPLLWTAVCMATNGAIVKQFIDSKDFLVSCCELKEKLFVNRITARNH